jgi:hypothetical protein
MATMLRIYLLCLLVADVVIVAIGLANAWSLLATLATIWTVTLTATMLTATLAIRSDGVA